MAHEEKAVHGDLPPLQPVDHAGDALAGNAGFLRCGFFECEHGCVHGSSPFGNGSLRGSVMIYYSYNTVQPSAQGVKSVRRRACSKKMELKTITQCFIKNIAKSYEICQFTIYKYWDMIML